MTKAKALLEEIKLISDQMQPGQYVTEFEFEADLSNDLHAKEGDEDWATLMDDAIWQMTGDKGAHKKRLAAAIHNAVRGGVIDNAAITEIEYIGEFKPEHAQSMDDVKRALKKAKFKAQIQCQVELQSDVKVKVDNLITKAIKGAV